MNKTHTVSVSDPEIDPKSFKQPSVEGLRRRVEIMRILHGDSEWIRKQEESLAMR